MNWQKEQAGMGFAVHGSLFSVGASVAGGADGTYRTHGTLVTLESIMRSNREQGTANGEPTSVNGELRTANGKPPTRLGQGTWRMGERADRHRSEVKALQLGFDLGMTLVDTAEMYGEGRAEVLVGEAIAGRRKDIFLVSKVYPHRASRSGVLTACEESLKRLKTDYLDLYLLHWRGSIPLAETFEGFLQLKQQGMIREFGVSNFDVDDMQQLAGVPGGREVFTDQVLYNLTRRGIEWDLLPWCRDRKMTVMAYSPMEQGRLSVQMDVIARKVNANRFQLALAWLLHQDGVLVIPKAASEAHVIENRKALDIEIPEPIFAELDALFPPPRNKSSLEIL
ncbi:MAG TPA: aldo/keto reductase [Chthoniobacterales bacterium]|nr:aldo/keto reductase [Chthoniobacterales bacterium]